MIKQINSRSWSFIGNMEIRICRKKKGLQEQNDIQRNNIRNKIGIRTKDIQDSLSEIEEIKKTCTDFQPVPVREILAYIVSFINIMN